MWYIGGYLALNPASGSGGGLSGGGISAMVFFYLWTVFYTPSWNGTPWVINSEMFDQNTRYAEICIVSSVAISLTCTLRSLGQASAAANNWFWNFIISRFTPQMFNAWGYGVYFFFASLMICSAIFIFFLMPETKSIPLETMDRLFTIKPVWRANKTIMAELAEEQGFRQYSDDGSGEKSDDAEINQVERKDSV